MGHGDRFLVPYLLFKKSTVWDKEPVPVSHHQGTCPRVPSPRPSLPHSTIHAKKPASMELAFLNDCLFLFFAPSAIQHRSQHGCHGQAKHCHIAAEIDIVTVVCAGRRRNSRSRSIYYLRLLLIRDRYICLQALFRNGHRILVRCHRVYAKDGSLLTGLLSSSTSTT